MANNIGTLKKYLNSTNSNLIINQINEEINEAYIRIIEYFARKHCIKISFENFNVNNNNLFGDIHLQIIYCTNAKKLNEILNSSEKKIIFTDYKNFKKINSDCIKINSYQHESDISLFAQEEFLVNNNELINFCRNNPALLFSELTKYSINEKNYISDSQLYPENNHITNLRKIIFNLKKENLNIKSLYLNIKKEAYYKKLNFLIY
tara:strand:+ start:3021 stop:3638 length:618 start_codon:yes stop_codon:yes gene_type:complete